MTDNNVVIRHLQAIRATLDEHGERLGRIETRLERLDHTLTRRVERIERRLELQDDPNG